MMILEHSSKNKGVLLIISAIVILGGLIFLAWRSPEPEPVFCTMEAKLCPDGSYVGRSGPKCEFASCPSADSGQFSGGNWKTFNDDRSVSFEYPEKLTTEFIHAVDWPPQLQITDEPFSCTEAGSETARAGRTEKRMVDNREYCVTKASEGAAGSVYTQYAYAFPKNNGTAIFTFSLRSVQCGNYDEPNMGRCEAEREAFDMDGVMDRMARTLVLLPEGYTLESYSVEKVSETSCVRNSDCETPAEYLLQSRCPFTSLCLEKRCVVVCPSYDR
jgi:hypothetical protein